MLKYCPGVIRRFCCLAAKLLWTLNYMYDYVDILHPRSAKFLSSTAICGRHCRDIDMEFYETGCMNIRFVFVDRVITKGLSVMAVADETSFLRHQ
jgi:hypothetical protein